MKKYILIGLFIALVIVFGTIIAFQATPTTTPNNSNQTSGVSVPKDKILYFYRDTCHYCQQEKPIVDELEKEGIPIQKMDVGANPDYISKYQIEGTPTFMIKDINTRLTGFQQKDTIVKFWNDNK